MFGARVTADVTHDVRGGLLELGGPTPPSSPLAAGGPLAGSSARRSITLISSFIFTWRSPHVRVMSKFPLFIRTPVTGRPPPSGPGEQHPSWWFGVWDESKDGGERGPTLLFTWAPFSLHWTLPSAEWMRQKFGVQFRAWWRHLPNVTHQPTTSMVFVRLLIFL